MKLTESEKNKAKLFGVSVAQDLFDNFLQHPKDKGPAFSWDVVFPSMCSRYAKSQCGISFVSTRTSRRIAPYVARIAKQHAKRLVETAKKNGHIKA